MVISIPTGAKLFNWLFTMYRGRIRFELPMMWTIAFMLTFTIGGMTGVMMAVPAADFVLHNSVFLIAHFHNVIIGGVVFGVFAAINYWWPKAFGFKLNQFWGKVQFWCWVVGFWLAFTPLYMLGLMGVTRRMRVFDHSFDDLRIYYIVAMLGALLIAAGIGAMLLQFAISIWKREEYKDVSGDPWDGRTLEWATSSPPPEYNFAFTPIIHDLDAWADMKKAGVPVRPRALPTSTCPARPGLVLAGLATGIGFALIWQVWWPPSPALPCWLPPRSSIPSTMTAAITSTPRISPKWKRSAPRSWLRSPRKEPPREHS
jgi:cytochrome o ubiquinol oxidase subunit 1